MSRTIKAIPGQNPSFQTSVATNLRRLRRKAEDQFYNSAASDPRHEAAAALRVWKFLENIGAEFDALMNEKEDLENVLSWARCQIATKRWTKASLADACQTSAYKMSIFMSEKELPKKYALKAAEHDKILKNLIELKRAS